jgi:hypothetical protein
MPDDAGPALALAQEQIVQLHELLELYYRDAEILRAELARRDRGLIRRLARRMRRNRV